MVELLSGWIYDGWVGGTWATCQPKCGVTLKTSQFWTNQKENLRKLQFLGMNRSTMDPGQKVFILVSLVL